MSTTQSPKIDKTLVGWSDKFRKHGLEKLAEIYSDEDFARDFKLIKDLGLPTYDSYLIPPEVFILNLESYKCTFVHPKYYLQLYPLTPGLRKHSLIGFDTLQQAKDFINEKIPNQLNDYMLRISEFEPNIYGGSIISNDDIVVAELAEGLQTGVSYGTAKVVGGALTTFNRGFRYSTDDEQKRLLLSKAITAIKRNAQQLAEDFNVNRKNHVIRGDYFLKGYFEFAYTQLNPSSEFRLVFFDAKLVEAYYNINAEQVLEFFEA